MSNAMKIEGQLTGVEFNKEGQMTDVQGKIEQVTFENGEKVTIIGEIKRIMRESRTSTASAFKVEIPGKPAEFISSDNSPKLFNDDGSPRELPKGAVVKQEFQAKAGSEEESLPEESETATSESGETEEAQETLATEEVSVEEKTEEA